MLFKLSIQPIIDIIPTTASKHIIVEVVASIWSSPLFVGSQTIFSSALNFGDNILFKLSNGLRFQFYHAKTPYHYDFST